MAATEATTNVENIEAPENWHWGIGNRSGGHYTSWLYTDKVLYQDGQFGFEGMVYWDGGKHHVAFYDILKLQLNGDVIASEYPCYSSTHDTELEAVKDAVRKAGELR